MCIDEVARHSCGYSAHGTTAQEPFKFLCRQYPEEGFCYPHPPFESDHFIVDRRLCNSCIIDGELKAQAEGKEPGEFCQGQRVSLETLKAADPGKL